MLFVTDIVNDNYSLPSLSSSDVFQFLYYCVQNPIGLELDDLVAETILNKIKTLVL